MCKCDELRQLLAAACKERDELRREVNHQAAEMDAMLCSLRKIADCADCKHNSPDLPCGDLDWSTCVGCTMEKVICCGCSGEKWEWKGADGFGKT